MRSLKDICLDKCMFADITNIPADLIDDINQYKSKYIKAIRYINLSQTKGDPFYKCIKVKHKAVYRCEYMKINNISHQNFHTKPMINYPYNNGNNRYYYFRKSNNGIYACNSDYNPLTYYDKDYEKPIRGYKHYVYYGNLQHKQDLIQNRCILYVFTKKRYIN